MQILLESSIDHQKSTFDDHISDICKNADRKIFTLARVTPYMGIAKKHMQMKTFFTLQFSYCPLVWMCHNHANSNRLKDEKCMKDVFMSLK